MRQTEKKRSEKPTRYGHDCGKRPLPQWHMSQGTTYGLQAYTCAIVRAMDKKESSGSR